MIANIIKNSILVCASIAVALLIFEAFLRFTDRVAEPHFYRAHPVLLYEPSPNTAGLRSGENKTPIWYANTEQGFRQSSSSTATQNQDDLIQGNLIQGDIILFLGDSFTEAAQVEAEDTFVELTEATLNAAGNTITAVNAGVSGYGTDQQLVTYLNKGRRLKPKLVVLAFCTGNDVSDNSRVLSPGYGMFFDLIDGKLQGPITQGKPPNPLKEFLNRYTRLIPWLIEKKRLWHHLQMQINSFEGEIFVSTGNPDWEHAWAITERLIERLDYETQQDGAQLMIAVLPVGYQIYNDPRHTHRADENFYLVEQRLQDIATRNRIPLLPLLDKFKKAAKQQQEPLFFDQIGHFTVSGHQLTTHHLAPFIAEQL